jgi:3-oxoacyl-[acyl-carrier protein] reductase
MGLLDGKRVIVTGASRGIGKAVAVACAREGAMVGVNYHTSEEEARVFVAENADSMRLLPFDVSDSEAVTRGVSAFVDHEGGIDCLVNNAGIVCSDLLIKASVDGIRRQIDTNLLGPILVTQAVLPLMVKQHSGVILNVGSVAAVRPMRGQCVYAATKGGIESLTRALAVEYASRNIRVIALRSGPVRTRLMAHLAPSVIEKMEGQVLLGRFASPEEIAEMAVFLLSDKARFSTGSVYTVDGGFSEG